VVWKEFNIFVLGRKIYNKKRHYLSQAMSFN